MIVIHKLYDAYNILASKETQAFPNTLLAAMRLSNGVRNRLGFFRQQLVMYTCVVWYVRDGRATWTKEWRKVDVVGASCRTEATYPKGSKIIDTRWLYVNISPTFSTLQPQQDVRFEIASNSLVAR